MNPWLMVGLFVGLMVGAFVYAMLVPQRPRTINEHFRDAHNELVNLGYLIGTELTPIFKSAIEAFQEFEEAFTKAWFEEEE